MSLRFLSFIFAGLFVYFSFMTGLQARQGDSLEAKMQIYAEYGLKDLKGFLNDLDPFVTNEGNDEQKKLYRRIVLRYMQSKTQYYSFHFSASVNNIKRSHRLLIYMLKPMLDNYHDRVKARVTRLAGVLLNQRRPVLARTSGLALRDLENAYLTKLRADNIQVNQLGNKIKYYLESLKYINHAVTYYIRLKLRAEAIYPLKDETSFNKIESNIKTGLPKLKNDLIPLLYTSWYRCFYLPSIKEVTWKEAPNYRALLKENEELVIIEDPPVRDGRDVTFPDKP